MATKIDSGFRHVKINNSEGPQEVTGAGLVDAKLRYDVSIYDSATATVDGNPQVYMKKNGKVDIGGEASVLATGRTRVNAKENASVYLYSLASCEAKDTVVVKARGMARVRATDNCVVYAYEHVSVEAMGNAVVFGFGNARIKLSEQAIAIPSENCCVESSGNSIVIPKGMSQISATGESIVVGYPKETTPRVSLFDSTLCVYPYEIDGTLSELRMRGIENKKGIAITNSQDTDFPVEMCLSSPTTKKST